MLYVVKLQLIRMGHLVCGLEKKFNDCTKCHLLFPLFVIILLDQVCFHTISDKQYLCDEKCEQFIRKAIEV